MKKWISIFVMPLLLFGKSFLAAQHCDHVLAGTVLDAETNEPLAFANIIIEETNTGAVTDEAGHFEIGHLCDGTYTVKCTHIGCHHAVEQVKLEGNSSIKFILTHDVEVLDEVKVTATAEYLETQATEGISGFDLTQSQGQTLGDVLEQLPGVSTITTGSTIAKPVIQGLHSNRILILNNGARQEGQQWGLEHAPEIDPFLADNITVVKGANSVRYGADAIGGVILVEPRQLRSEKGIGGEVNLAGFSNGRMGVVSGMLDGKLEGKLPIAGRIQGTLKKGGDLKTPGYFLDNTGVEEYNYSWALGLKKERFETELFYSRFFTRIGIFSGSHIGNVTDLQAAIDRGEPLLKPDFSYELGRPLQQISHELVKAKNSLKTGKIGKLSLQYARQFNRRGEFDAHRTFGDLPDNLDDPDLEFEITTHSGDLVWSHKSIHHFSGEIGTHFMHQMNTTDRGALIPNFESYGGGVFWIERWNNYPFPLELEGGIRYDFKHLDIGFQGNEWIGDKLDFQNVSASLGAIYRAGKFVKIRLHYGSAWRSPHVNELYSDGVHHGSASYEKGRVDLVPERANNTSLSFGFEKEKLLINLSVYYNHIKDYIFLEPQENPVLTIRGAFPAFFYEQADARILGMDWSASYQLMAGLYLNSSISVLRGKNESLQDYLFFMPADQFRHSLKYVFKEEQLKKNAPFVSLTMVNAMKQNRVPEGKDFAPPPSAYTLINFGAGFQTTGKYPLSLSLTVENLFDIKYREYLNRFRYFADELGRNISLKTKLSF